MTNLLSLSYWFSINPPPFLPAVERGLLVAFAVWMLGGVAASLFLMKQGIEKPTRRMFEKAAALLTWSGLTGLVLWAFAYERIPVLSMRVLFLLVVIWIAIGGYDLIRYVMVEIPATRKVEAEREQQMRWLPRKKK